MGDEYQWEMNINSVSGVNVKLWHLFFWWIAYIVIDTLIFSFLYQAHILHITQSRSYVSFSWLKIAHYSLAGLIGKTLLILQFPFMLLLIFVCRRRLRIVHWFCLPFASVVLGYAVFLLLVTLDNYVDGMGLNLNAIKTELKRWLEYEYIGNAVYPMAFISTIMATFVWSVLLLIHWENLENK